MTHNRDLVLIRKLCGLGLPAQTLAPSLLPALRQVIPSHSAAVFWVDERFEMTGLYAERLLPPEAMERYYEKHYQQPVTGFPRAFAGARCGRRSGFGAQVHEARAGDRLFSRRAVAARRLSDPLWCPARHHAADRPDQYLPRRARSRIRAARSGRVARSASLSVDRVAARDAVAPGGRIGRSGRGVAGHRRNRWNGDQRAGGLVAARAICSRSRR